MRPTSVASEADMKPGNKKGTNPGPPDRTRRTSRTAIVLRTPPPVLNSTAVHCGTPFGTKRPQVQILSPRPVFPQARGPTPSGVGPSVCPVPQRSTATGVPNIDMAHRMAHRVGSETSCPKSGSSGRLGAHGWSVGRDLGSVGLLVVVTGEWGEVTAGAGRRMK